VCKVVGLLVGYLDGAGGDIESRPCDQTSDWQPSWGRRAIGAPLSFQLLLSKITGEKQHVFDSNQYSPSSASPHLSVWSSGE